jgi:hypothetical protein
MLSPAFGSKGNGHEATGFHRSAIRGAGPDASRQEIGQLGVSMPRHHSLDVVAKANDNFRTRLSDLLQAA